MSNRDSLKVHSKDSNSIAMGKNKKLLEIIRKLEKENKRLKSQYKTMETAWGETEEKYKEAVMEIPMTSKDVKIKCNKCKSLKFKKIQFDGFHVVRCENCNYRNKIDDKPIS